MTGEAASLGCAETARRVGAGELSAAERTEAALAAIAARDGGLGAFLLVDPEGAMARAHRVDGEAALRRGPLAGVPIAIKDNLCLEGAPTTAGSRILEGWIAPYTATAVQRLLDAGAVIVGKTNLDEFAMGSSTENSAYRRTVNPRDRARVPGGSSGGSAAAVGAGLVPGALGSDTGGSIRQPAALCGVTGLKPTYGRVSRYGLVAFASSLDQIGPLARDVTDAALLLAVIAGPDPRDSTCMAEPAPGPAPPPPAEPSGVRAGVLVDWLEGGIAPAIRSRVQDVVRALEQAGVQVQPIHLPHQELAIATYCVIATAEASSNLARYDGVRLGLRAGAGGDLQEMMARTRSEGFGAEVKRRILLGTFVLSAGYYDAYYGRAQRVRTLLRRDLAAAFEKVDVLIGPTTPSTAFALGECTADPLQMYLADVFTVPANLAGLPALSLPCGDDEAGLPIGIQLIGPALAEERLLSLGRLIEQLRGG